MAFPAGWVGLVLGDVAEGLRGLDDRLDASPEPGRGLRRAGPQRLQDHEQGPRA